MDPRTGKKIRSGRIIRPDTKRAIVIAASHGVLTGPPDGLRTGQEALATLGQLRSADAIMVAPGMVTMVEELFVGRESPGLVIELDWKSWNRGTYPPLHDGRSEGATAQLSDFETLAAAGVDGVMSYLYVGQLDQQLEREEIERNARYARECDRWGINLIIEPRSAREGLEHEATSPKVLAFYSRMAAEIGADIVKCVWPGSAEGLHEVVSATYCPVLLAGGPGDETQEGAVALASQALAAGAAGVMFGRKVYRSPNPEGTLRALRALIHGDSV